MSDRDRLRRAAFDLMAYGHHSPICTKGKVIIPRKGMRAAICEKRCTCGLDAALDSALARPREAAKP